MHVRASIIAWELMTPELRKSWLAAIERELKRRERIKPKEKGNPR